MKIETILRPFLSKEDRKTTQLLVAGFSAIIILMIGLQVEALRQANTLAELTSKMYRHPLAVSNAVLQANSNIISMQLHMKDAALARNREDLEAAISKVNAEEAMVYKQFDIIQERFLGSRATVQSARTAFANWQPIRTRIVELTIEGKHEEVDSIVNGLEVQYISVLAGKMELLTTFARSKAVEFNAVSEGAHNQSRKILVGTMTVVLAIAAAIAILVTVKVHNSDKRLQESQRHLRQSQKMEAVGQLTGGIAHDFNNILSIVIGNLELLQQIASDNRQIQQRVELALKGARRGGELTDKLLGFSRKKDQDIELVIANTIIEQMEKILSVSVTSKISIQTELSKELWPIEADPGDLQDSILNLVLNARDAMPDGGTLTIETSNEVIGGDSRWESQHEQTGEFVVLTINDTGSGMPQEVRERALEPFFTTKPGGKGTGLGLSMVYGFAQRSKGHVNIYSEPGLGTTVRVFLPRADVITGRKKELGAPTRPIGGTETILVVDDEADMIEIAEQHLKSLGYRTYSAANGSEALNVLENHPDIDLIFTDINMPGNMDGARLANLTVESRPNLKVLLTSGFAPNREEINNSGNAFDKELLDSMLSKPYDKATLATSIRSALDKSTRRTP